MTAEQRLHALSRPFIVVLVLALALALPLHAAKLRTKGGRWDTHELMFRGPYLTEDGDPNPFRHFRLDCTFSHPVSGVIFVVPGFFAADGNAAQTGASAGRVWTVLFTPPRTGLWQWRVRFVEGINAALTASGTAKYFNGEKGEFTVGESKAKWPDLRVHGRLQYVGQRYFRFADGTRLLKLGTNSPENLLGYADFDGAKLIRGRNARHDYSAHVKDWRSGDPTWRGDKGKGLIGAINYLHSKQVNSLFALLMTVLGDSRGDVFPWIAEQGQMFRFDVSKLAQWQIVFEYATKKGMTLNLSFLETENEALFESVANKSLTTGFADNRRLFYRELLARFSHNVGLTMTLGEENGWSEELGRSPESGKPWGKGNTPYQRAEFTHYIRQVDPYDCPVMVHTFPPLKDEVYNPLLTSNRARVEAASLQMGNMFSTNRETATWVARSAAQGRQWVVSADEFHGGTVKQNNIGGVPLAPWEKYVDSEYRGAFAWGNVLAGGAGVELFTSLADQTLGDFRELEWAWSEFARVRTFFDLHNVPFWAMGPRNDLLVVKNSENKNSKYAYCLAHHGEAYVAYVSVDSQKIMLDLSIVGKNVDFQVRWYSPRAGETTDLARGSLSKVSGGRKRVNVGKPPNDSIDKDWVLLVARTIPFDSSAKTLNSVSPRDLVPGAMTLGKSEKWS